MSPQFLECARKRRETLQILKGMVAEVEAKRMLLLAIIEDRPNLAAEAQTKLPMLENSLNCINFTLDLVDNACAMCQCVLQPNKKVA